VISPAAAPRAVRGRLVESFAVPYGSPRTRSGKRNRRPEGTRGVGEAVELGGGDHLHGLSRVGREALVVFPRFDGEVRRVGGDRQVHVYDGSSLTLVCPPGAGPHPRAGGRAGRARRARSGVLRCGIA
jgi:hypothetical protein